VCAICSCSVMANRLSWAAWETSLDCSTFMSHLNTDHTCDLPEIRKIFQLHYSTVNQSPSQQICKCLATGDTALCLHAVQQCGCKIIQREQMWCFRWLCYTVWWKLQLRQKWPFAILDIRGWYCTGCCSFKITFLNSLTTAYEARGKWLQVAQHLLVPGPK